MFTIQTTSFNEEMNMKEINPNIITKSEVFSGGVVACRNRRKSRSKFRIPPSIKKSMPKKSNLCAIRRKPSIWLLGNPESLSLPLSHSYPRNVGEGTETNSILQGLFLSLLLSSSSSLGLLGVVLCPSLLWTKSSLSLTT